MIFRLYMLIDTDPRSGHSRYPYIAISPGYAKPIHICNEHISVNCTIDAVNFEREYIPTSRLFTLNMHHVNYICESYLDEPMYEMTIHFTGKKHIVLRTYNCERKKHYSFVLMKGEENFVGENVIRILYPLFDEVYRQVITLD